MKKEEEGRYKVYMAKESIPTLFRKGDYVLVDYKERKCKAYADICNARTFSLNLLENEIINKDVLELKYGNLPNPKYKEGELVTFTALNPSKGKTESQSGKVVSFGYYNSTWYYYLDSFERYMAVNEEFLFKSFYFFIDTKGNVRKAERGYDLTADDYRKKMCNMFATEQDALAARSKLLNYVGALDKKHHLKARLKAE
jgi:hypothetical protein